VRRRDRPRTRRNSVCVAQAASLRGTHEGLLAHGIGWPARLCHRGHDFLGNGTADFSGLRLEIEGPNDLADLRDRSKQVGDRDHLQMSAIRTPLKFRMRFGVIGFGPEPSRQSGEQPQLVWTDRHTETLRQPPLPWSISMIDVEVGSHSAVWHAVSLVTTLIGAVCSWSSLERNRKVTRSLLADGRFGTSAWPPAERWKPREVHRLNWEAENVPNGTRRAARALWSLRALLFGGDRLAGRPVTHWSGHAAALDFWDLAQTGRAFSLSQSCCSVDMRGQFLAAVSPPITCRFTT